MFFFIQFILFIFARIPGQSSGIQITSTMDTSGVMSQPGLMQAGPAGAMSQPHPGAPNLATTETQNVPGIPQKPMV